MLTPSAPLNTISPALENAVFIVEVNKIKDIPSKRDNEELARQNPIVKIRRNPIENKNLFSKAFEGIA